MKKNRRTPRLTDLYANKFGSIEGIDFSKEDRLAFLSTQSRTYFPERPGTSRFAVAFAPHLGSPEDAGPLKYSPKDPRLYKPISKKGFGIGGLGAPRFAKDLHENTPPPWHYQPDVVPPINTYEPPKDNYLEFLRNSMAQSRQYGSSGKGLMAHRAYDPEPYQVPKSELVKYKPTFKECASQIIAFGSNKRNSRYGADKTNPKIKFQTAGVGHYEIRNPPSGKLKVTGSFGMGPNRMIPSVNDRCTHKAYDTCFECQNVISTADYYRTTQKVRNPLAKPIPLDPFDYLSSIETTTFTTKGSRQISPTFPTGSAGSNLDPIRNGRKNSPQPSDFLNHESANKQKAVENATLNSTAPRNKRSCVSSCVPVQKGLIFVNLCRKCYCLGLRGENRFWNKEFLTVNFKKTRNCSYIHDHQNIEHFIHKTSCKAVNKLRRRENLLAKYYADDPCIKVRKER